MAGGMPIGIEEPNAGAAGRGAGTAAGLGAAFFAGLLAARLAVFFFAGFLAFLAALFTGFLTVFLTVLLPAFFLVVFLAVFFTDFLVAFFLDFLDFAGMGSPPIHMVGALTGGTLSGRIVHQPSCFPARGVTSSKRWPDCRAAAARSALSVPQRPAIAGRSTQSDKGRGPA